MHFPGDDLEYHHRILLHWVAEGQWITLTPDLVLGRHDLAELDHVVLERNGSYPEQYASQVYGFDPIDRASLEHFKRLARTQAVFLGAGAPEKAVAHLRVFDGSGAKLGETVTAEILDGVDTFVSLRRRALVVVGDTVETASYVLGGELEDWRKARAEADSDVRLLGMHGFRWPPAGVRGAARGPRARPGRRRGPRQLGVVSRGVDQAQRGGAEQRGGLRAAALLRSPPTGPLDGHAGHLQHRRPGASQSAIGPTRDGDLALTPLPQRGAGRVAAAAAAEAKEAPMGLEEALGRAAGMSGGRSPSSFARQWKKEWWPGGAWEHADPFPLPECSGRGPNTSQHERARAAVRGLNQLAVAKANSECFRTTAPCGAGATEMQRRMLDGIDRRLDRLGLEPDLSSDEALRELLAGRDLYSCEPIHIAPFSEDLLRVTKGDVQPKDARGLLPAGAGRYLACSEERIVKSAEQIASPISFLVLPPAAVQGPGPEKVPLHEAAFLQDVAPPQHPHGAAPASLRHRNLLRLQ